MSKQSGGNQDTANKRQQEAPHSQEPAGSGTGGGGNPARDKAPVATSQAPKPAGGHREEPATAGSGAAGAAGIGSGLQPGGQHPTNERLAGEGRTGMPGAHGALGSVAAPGGRQGKTD